MRYRFCTPPGWLVQLLSTGPFGVAPTPPPGVAPTPNPSGTLVKLLNPAEATRFTPGRSTEAGVGDGILMN